MPKTVTVNASIDLEEIDHVYSELTQGEDWQDHAVLLDDPRDYDRRPIMKADTYALEAHDLALWLHVLKRMLLEKQEEAGKEEPQSMTAEERQVLRELLDAPNWRCTFCGHTEKGHQTSAAQGSRPCPECENRHFWTGVAPRWNPRTELRRAPDDLDAKDAQLALIEAEIPDRFDYLSLAEAVQNMAQALADDAKHIEALEQQRDQWRERAEHECGGIGGDGGE